MPGEFGRNTWSGVFRILMVRPGDGSGPGAIERYEIKGDVLEEWWLRPAAAKKWLEAKHPNVQDMKLHTATGFVTIEKLDDEVVGILAETLSDRPGERRLVDLTGIEPVTS